MSLIAPTAVATAAAVAADERGGRITLTPAGRAPLEVVRIIEQAASAPTR